ncbi:unnamed protein product, partial [Mesorhabditis spiculigera]
MVAEEVAAYKPISWWHEEKPSWARQLTLKFLKLNGPIPNHVAVIMDGNRRYARGHHMATVVKGHERGFLQLQKVLCWCRDMGIHEVTVYAFSIENFKRSQEEVDGLMDLAEEQFAKLLQESDELDDKKVCFRFWGRLELLRPTLRRLLVEVERRTANYSRSILNICIAYTAKDEALRAAQLIKTASEAGLIDDQQVNMPVLRECMDSRRSLDPDLIIRTSGEQRWSDFMLIQGCFTHVHFSNVLWPEFEHRHLFWAIYDYQRHCRGIQALPHCDDLPSDCVPDELQDFIAARHEKRLQSLLDD